ncbi:hypothetical protein MJD09_00165, partial [bacterium]|nr:hypothetical protein [bacterium]
GGAALFPAKVVKKNGSFGLINQGIIDGIRMGDVVKLYRKEGKHIDFKGKAYVRKVAERFSLVEMIKTKKLQYLEIDDSGFVDRSFSSNAVRGFRTAVGTVLQGLAARLGRAAHNVEGNVEPGDNPKEIESDPVPKQVPVQPKIVTPKSQPIFPSPRLTRVPASQHKVTVVDQALPRPQHTVPIANHTAPRPHSKVTVVDSPVEPQSTVTTIDRAALQPRSNVSRADRAVPQPQSKVTIVDQPVPQSQPSLTIVNQPPKAKTAPVGFGLEHL